MDSNCPACNVFEDDFTNPLCKMHQERFMNGKPVEHAQGTIEDTLKERGGRYGEFGIHAVITQNIKSAMRDSPNWRTLPPDMKEALEMVAHKVGRILNGDPNYKDSWHDIIGYTKLIDDRLED